MLPIRDHTPYYTHSIPLSALPEEWHKVMHEVASNDEYNIRDYSDGDFYYPLDFSLLERDQTPSEVLDKFAADPWTAEDEDYVNPSDYPFGLWKQVGGFYSLPLWKYASWLRALRYIAENVPPEMLKPKTLAINFGY